MAPWSKWLNLKLKFFKNLEFDIPKLMIIATFLGLALHQIFRQCQGQLRSFQPLKSNNDSFQKFIRDQIKLGIRF